MVSSFMSRRKHKIDGGLLIAAALALFAIQALLKPGLPTYADLSLHLYRTLEYAHAWAPGMILPRWAPNMAFGYGYPLFVFAAPLTYMLTTLFHLAGFTLETAFKLLLILSLLLYSLGMYLMTRDMLRNVPGALVAATAYTFAPFALREVLLYGGNIPQYLAIAFFPWTLWAAYRATTSKRWGWIALTAAFFAAIMLSHLFHTVIFTAVLAAFLLLLLASNYEQLFDSRVPLSRRLWAALKPFLALPLGLLLSAFFWIPAFIERYYARALANIYLEKSPFFIRYPYWPELVNWIQPLDTRAANPYVPLSLGLVTLSLAGLGLLAGLVFYWRHIPKQTNSQDKADARAASPPHQTLFILFFAALAVLTIFMALPVSRPVWQTVSILQIGQFPWRMLALANLGLSFLAGAALLLVPVRFRGVSAAAAITLLLIGIAPYLYPVIPFTQYGSPTIADQINYELSSQSIGTTTLGEFLPRTVEKPPTTSPLVNELKAGSFPERLDRTSLPPQAEATLVKQNAAAHHYRISSPSPFTLRLLQFYFPGWQAELNDRSVPIRPEPETGLILVDIPAGEHLLTVEFGQTWDRLMALLLTGLGFAIIIVVLFRNREPSPEPGPTGTQANRQTLFIVLGIALLALVVTPRLHPFFTISSPPGNVLPAQHQTDIRFTNGIQLAGYDLSGQIIQPGDYLQVVLYWQTDSAPYRVNLQPFVHLDRLDSFTTIADATNYTPGDVTTEINMPTFHWDNDRYVRDEHDLIIPPNTPPLAYAVRVGLINPDNNNQLIPLANGSDDTAWIATINVAGNHQTNLAQPLDVTLSNQVDALTLTGFQIEEITPQQLDFSLAWESDRTPQADYTIFAQLLDSGNNLVAGFDRPPLDEAYPTSTWLAGQSILDPRRLPLVDVPPGEYTLIVGAYNPETGQRLTTESGADFVPLTTIALER